jgi:hypothetical protein
MIVSGCWLTLGLDDKTFDLDAAGGSAGATGGGGGPGGMAGAGGQATGCGALPTPMPVISRDVPAFASADADGSYPARLANDLDFSSDWRSGEVPAWLAYDLSGSAESARGRVVVVYYNGTPGYDHGVTGTASYSNAGSYTIEASAAPGGDLPPEDSWEVLVTVRGNTAHSRQHVVDLGGRAWIRINVTVSDGSRGNEDVALAFDVHDASQGVCDDWIFFGDGLTESALDTYGDTGNLPLAPRVQAEFPDRFPLMEGAGSRLITADEARNAMLGDGGWLSLFPGRYVVLAYGWEDAREGTSPPSFYNYLRDLVVAVIAAGKVPVIPLIASSEDSAHREDILLLNAQIELLLGDFPEIVRGPDLFAATDGQAEFMPDSEGLLDDAATALIRASWLAALRDNVYAP